MWITPIIELVVYNPISDTPIICYNIVTLLYNMIVCYNNCYDCNIILQIRYIVHHITLINIVTIIGLAHSNRLFGWWKPPRAPENRAFAAPTPHSPTQETQKRHRGIRPFLGVPSAYSIVCKGNCLVIDDLPLNIVIVP